MASTFTLDPTKWFENGRGQTAQTVGAVTYYQIGNGARQKWTTSARKMTVHSYAEYDSSFVNNGRIGLLVNGVPYFYRANFATGAFTTTLWLPVGANKTVELLVPLQFAASAGAAPVGVFPYLVQFDENAIQINPSLRTEHLLIYGDSIASGGVAITPSLFGYAGLFKTDESNGTDRSVTLMSWGTRRLHDDCDTAPHAATLAAAQAALSPTKILNVIGSNDHSVVPGVLVATHQIEYGYLLDAQHTAMPTVPLVCVTPIRRGAEGANGNGETMAQFRTAQTDVVNDAARQAWGVPPVVHDGLGIFADLTQLPDNVHPGTTGNATMKTALAAWI